MQRQYVKHNFPKNGKSVVERECPDCGANFMIDENNCCSYCGYGLQADNAKCVIASIIKK